MTLTDFTPPEAPAARRATPAALVRLRPPPLTDPVFGWLAPLGVALLAFLLRFHRLGIPKDVAFDEVYYSCDAQNLLRFGYEHAHDKCVPKADELGSFIAHPPLGKWMIAAGEKVFGYPDAVGWRISACVIGALAVLLLCRIGRRMFRSTLLGCIAGLLLTLDGLHFVLSRVAMLDIFLLFWVVAAFGCLVVDRDIGRARLADRILDSDSSGGPKLGFRWWRLAAGICLGAACAVKWSGVYYLVAFALLVLAWEIGARRTAGISRPVLAALRREALSIVLLLGVVAVVVYVGSWAGWFVTEGGWRRSCMDNPPWANASKCGPVKGWIEYHLEILRFHQNLSSPHPYESGPWSWLLLGRPVSYFYATPSQGMSQEILGIGTPAIWWASIFALVVTFWRWVSRRDWRAAAILVGFAAGYLPWFLSPDRTMFLFYAAPSLPFMCLALAYVCGLVLGPDHAPRTRRTRGAFAVAAYVGLVVLNFVYLYPILAAQVIPYETWRDHMWLNSWI